MAAKKQDTPELRHPEFWAQYIPSKQRMVPAEKRHLVSLSASEIDRLSALGEEFSLSNPAMITTLVNLAEAIQNDEAEL